MPKIWEGGEAWIIGGGYSILDQFEVPMDVRDRVFKKETPVSAFSPYLKPIHDKHIIGINTAFLLGSWVDIVFFGDSGFYLRFKQELREYKGIKITSNTKFEQPAYKFEDIKVMPKDRKQSVGINPKPGRVSWNENSGCAAISLAVHSGVKRIILLGFDMKLSKDGKQHWHALYKTADRANINPRKLPFERHMKGMQMIKRDAVKLGVEIINANPNSAIDQFEKANVKDLL